MALTKKKFIAISQLLKEQINRGEKIQFKVTSKSMRPLIRVGDEVIVDKIIPSTLQPGEIILFERGNVFCTHRFIRRIKKNNRISFVTKGDNLARFDPPITENVILGKVVTIKHNSKRIDLTSSTYNLLNKTLAKAFTFQWFIFVQIRPIRYMLINLRDKILNNI